MNAVSLLRATTYDIFQLRTALIQLLEPLGGLERIVKSGDRFPLTPNFLKANLPD